MSSNSYSSMIPVRLHSHPRCNVGLSLVVNIKVSSRGLVSARLSKLRKLTVNWFHFIIYSNELTEN